MIDLLASANSEGRECSAGIKDADDQGSIRHWREILGEERLRHVRLAGVSRHRIFEGITPIPEAGRRFGAHATPNLNRFNLVAA